MIVDKKTKTEVLKVYDKWLHSYLHGDVKTYDFFLDDEYHFIGSTNNEEFLNRKATTNFFEATAEQLAGKCDLRNETQTIEQFGDLIFITHVFDAWFLNDSEYNYYGRFRFTSALRKNKEGWRFIYQHFSTPDSKTATGETIGFDKISEENKELREAIQRRTYELEAKNRALEIEGALQRIRAEAVAMKESSDLLDIVVTLRTEFIKLGHEAHYFWHMMWLEDTYEKAMTAGDGTKIGFVMELPKHIHGDISLLAKWEKSKKPTIVYPMNVEETIDYVDKMIALGDFKNIDPQAPTHDDIRHIGGLTFIMARTTHGEIGYSLPGVVKNPPKEDIDILVKFSSAFDLAHQRFLDLQKAEKQARETQIELALEKVRSRTMAMQHSDELRETSFLLDQQVRELGIKTWGCAFNIYGENESTEWFGNEAGVLQTYTVPRAGIFKEYYDKGQKGETLVVQEFSGEDCVAHYEYMSTLPVIGDVLKTLKETNTGFPTYQIDHVVYFKYGYLLFITRESVPDTHDIFKRFAKVFEQTYTRFLDLKKAEAQAKEAQIEASLERVRSRSMAMQSSDELTAAGALLYHELSKLSIQNLTTGYTLFDKTATIGWNYGVNPMDGSIRHRPVGMNHTTTKVMKAIAASWKKQEPLLVIQLNEKETIKHQTFIAEESIGFPISKEKLLSISPKRLVVHTFNFKQGYLLIVGGELLSVDQQEMIARFANVFQQTYTRFLDLQKAEAQAREAQIEVALERVRSRSIGMQRSEELAQVVLLLDEELIGLGIEVNGTQIVTDFDNPEKNVTVWFGLKGQDYLERFQVPYLDNPMMKKFYSAWKKRVDFYTEQYSKTDKNKILRQIFINSDFRKTSEERKAFIYDSPGLTRASALFKNSILIFQRYHLTEFSEEEVLVFKRFGKVFEQAYTRFLDLQKAEAQAKEAQIETALEKVRSRSMAMQQSDEIGDVAKVLYEQLSVLGGALWGTGFGFCKENTTNDEYWFVNERGVMPPLKIPHTKDPTHKAMYKGWQDNLEILSIAKDGKELEKHYNYMLSVPDVQPIFQGMLDSGISFPIWQKWHAAYFKFGYLLVITTEPYPDEEIFIRFAKVFEQSYTRFLDLQKAEAQTRENQIELALERVRSRSMAMQKSEELKEVIQIVYEQFINLNINIEHTGFIIDYKKNDAMHIWLADKNEVAREVVLPYFDCAHWNSFKEAKAKGKRFFANKLSLKEKNKFYKDLFKLIPDVPEGLLEIYLNYSGLAISTVLLDSVGLYIENFDGIPYSEKENDTLMRFGKVFQQTYTRFLDLQKAEAQAREAQIEASLERVRSRAMAMRQSEDLVSCTRIVFDELEKLNLSIERSGIGIFDPASKDCQLWTTVVATDGRKELVTGVTSLTVHPMLIETFIAWENQKPCSYILEGKELEDYYTLVTKSEFVLSEELIEKSAALPKEYYHYSPFGAGGLYFFSNSEPFDEDKQIIHRFAEVFDLTYTRFLDLQKAEAQAREAQIEAALEKVRSRSLAMQKPEELQEVVAVVAEKLKDLGVIFDAGGVILCTYFPENKDMLHWIAVDDFSTSGRYFLPYFDTPILSEAWDSKLRGDAYFSKEFTVEAKDHFFEYAFEHSDYKHFPEDYKQHVLQAEKHSLSGAWSKNSAIIIPTLTGAVPSKSDAEIMKRFAKVFEQAYIRFMDLQKAEAQTREAQIQASLERVRSVALSMQKTDDMLDVAQVLYEQLISLGFADIRNSIIDLHNDEDDETFWDYDYSEEMSGTVTLMRYDDDPIIEKQLQVMVSSTDAFFELVLEGKDLQDLKEMRIKNGEAEDPRLNTINQLTYNLYSFGNGAIGISNFGILSDTEKVILKRFRNVFTLAYKRYSDLSQAEAQVKLVEQNLMKLKTEKRRAEEALTDLQQTQKQLIQSEKMASLGELTAGIAHEIQNPLNFVNNFSEVSSELIEEIDEEIAKGDMDEVKAILLDVKQNLEKINHHGKRADAIVKGMLQHSRKSTAEKEPTDINKLADEYLRLAYHGLRAKDKSFNATLKTDFDEQIGKVDVIPQDMGRVILNLITNAFYACTERSRSACTERNRSATNERKKASQNSDFKPTVSVSTKQLCNQVLISVKDNGNGIPKDAIDKIFQPFFTTKPTGEGTGLGLSMSYDIVTKGHNGELEVKTKERKGTEFIIKLPLIM